MAGPAEDVVIYYTEDGQPWAEFLSQRLQGPDYNISSLLRDFTPASWSVPPDHDSSPARFSDLSNNSSEADLADSGRGSRNLPELVISTEPIQPARAHVVLLSPDNISRLDFFPLNITALPPKITVFLFLGVDIEEVRTYFGRFQEFVFESPRRCSVIHSDDSAVRDAMVQIIQAFESEESNSLFDDEDEEEKAGPYNVPGPAIQLNGVEEVIPRELSPNCRDVYVLLTRQAEDTVTARLETHATEIPLTLVCDRLYRLTLPDNARGELFLQFRCQHHTIGIESILAPTKLDRIYTVLQEEVEPFSVIAAALGLPPNDLEGVDAALASRLEQLDSPGTLHSLFPREEQIFQYSRAERAGIKYPTLLHFAVDWNLVKFCSRLLSYPGMLAAVSIKNKDGDNPSMLAFKRGLSQMEAMLEEFEEEQTSIMQDYVSPLELHPAPKPHNPTRKPDYVNQPSQDSPASNYIQMSSPRRPVPDMGSQPSDLDLMSPTSDSSVFIDTDSLMSDGDSVCQVSEYSAGSDQLSQNSSTSNPPPKAMKILGMTDKDNRTSTLTRSPHRAESSGATSGRTPKSYISRGLHYPSSSTLPDGMERLSLSSNCDDPEAYRQAYATQDSKDSKLKKKIGNLIGKMKKKIPSEGDNPYGSTRNLKKSSSGAGDKSKKKVPDANTQERDSGSYSDEEKNGGKSSRGGKLRHKQFKERDKPMERKRPQSRRVQIASQEQIGQTPALPKTGKFQSYVGS